MVDIICSRCHVFITTAPERPPEELLFCGNCMVEVLQAKIRLANDLATAVRSNCDTDWTMPQSVLIALDKFEEVEGGHKRH
jgi:ferredoxin